MKVRMDRKMRNVCSSLAFITYDVIEFRAKKLMSKFFEKALAKMEF